MVHEDEPGSAEPTRKSPNRRRSQGHAEESVGEGTGVNVSLDDAVRRGVARMQETTKLGLATIVAIEPLDEGWHMQIELVEKESIPHGMDILGLYDAWLDPGANLLRFTRRSIRRRSDVMDG